MERFNKSSSIYQELIRKSSATDSGWGRGGGQQGQFPWAPSVRDPKLCWTRSNTHPSLASHNLFVCCIVDFKPTQYTVYVTWLLHSLLARACTFQSETAERRWQLAGMYVCLREHTDRSEVNALHHWHAAQLSWEAYIIYFWTTNCLSSYKPYKFLQAWIASFQFAQFDQYIGTCHELMHWTATMSEWLQFYGPGKWEEMFLVSCWIRQIPTVKTCMSINNTNMHTIYKITAWSLVA